MKKNKNNNLMQSVLRAGVCLFALSGANALMAQADGVAPATASDSVAKVKKEAPKYKMKEVKGVIYDGATHKPMSGVMVAALNNPAYSALTNEDGSYTLSVPYFVHALYVNAPDYNPIQIPVRRKGNVDGYLHSNKFKGFYKDGTSITAQNSISLDNSSALSVETEIQNQLAGDVRSINRNGTPAQGAYMMIRGIHSLNTNNQPLIVLDGNMIDMQEDRTALHQGFVNNVLSGLDPEDIESIQVLKNGTALYGAKGANGVILINTKRGKSMATKINVDIYGGVVLKPQTIDMMKAEEFRSFLGDMLGESNKGLPSLSYVPFLNQDPDYFWYPMFHNETDWDEEMYRTTMTQNYKVSVEGGDEIAMYNLSLGYSQANSAMKNNDFNRLNLRFNTDIKIAEKLHTQLDIAYSRMAYNILDNGWAENYDDQNIAATNVLGLVQTPFLSKYAYYIGTDGKLHINDKIYAGKYAAESNLYNSPNLENPFNYASSVVPGENTVLNNPYWILENGKGEEKNFAELTQFNINVMPKWQITKQLSLTNRFNYALSRNNEKYYVPRNGSSPYALENLGNITSVLKSQFTKQTTINNDLRLNWGETYGAHDINIFGGWRYNNYSYSYSYLKGYNNTNDKMPILNYGRQYLQYSGTNDNWSDMAYYANLDYNFMNRYFIQASASAQASSRFGSNTEQGFQLAGVSWGVFPSVQLGWLISSESWFPKTKGINYLKLTAGFDMTGNDNIDYYAASTYWSSEKYLKESIGLVMQNIDNPKIQWETTTQYNVGLEGSFLNNRLQAGLNLFWSNTDHLLVKEKVSYLTGLEDYWTNNGAMKNAGFEVSANAALVNKRNWKWQVGATVGHYKNEITELPSSDVLKIKDEHGNVVKTINGYTSSIYGEDNVLTAVGHAAGVFYGFQTAGVFASDADARCHTNENGEKEYLKYPTGLSDANQAYKTFGAGDVHFVDQNGDGIINDADKVIIGDPNPDIYGNIYTMLNYKRLTLNVNLKYSLGNDVYNYQRSQIEGGNSFYNQSSAMVNRWTHEGQVTDIPRACYPLSDNWRNNERFSDRWIEDGSYLKIKNIRLTYDIPVSSTWLQGVKVWGEANDVFTLTKYLGTDPEISASNNILYQGIDNGMMPLTRSFNIGVSLNL